MPGHVAAQAELDDQGEDERRREQQGGVRQAEAEGLVDVVGEALADRGAQDLDQPEPDGDLRHLVQHLLWSGVANGHQGLAFGRRHVDQAVVHRLTMS